MINQPDAHLHSLFKSFARGGSVAVVFIGCSVLLGWFFDIAALKSLAPDAVTMKANTAVGFVLAGASLWLVLSDRTDRRIHRLKQACAVVVALIGLLTLSQYLSGWDLGIDQLLFNEPAGAVGTSNPGRMAPNTALNFLLIGLGLLLLDWETRAGRRPAQFLIISAGVIALLGLLGYAYGVTELYGFLSYTPMAINTVVAFVVLCPALLFARPDTGLMTIITNSGIGGLLARRLLLVALIVPAALGWIRLLGERAGLYDAAFGVSLMVVTNAAILIIMILAMARSLNRADVARQQAGEELRKAGALQNAIFNSANFSSIATDAKGVIQIFNVGAERMLGYAAADVMNKITPADISDPQEVIARAKALSVELGTPITPGFEALVFKASRGIEDIYELTYIRKDGSRFPAVVSVTALRDDQDAIIGYLLIGTDNTARKLVEAERERLNQALQDQNVELESARYVVEQANVTLEQRVEERTAQVVRTGRQLELLLDESNRRSQNLEALREIDNVVLNSLDLKLTLPQILTHVQARLNVDAADVLLLNPHSQRLAFGAGRGFRTEALKKTSLRLGEGNAGRAALERQIVNISDLRTASDAFTRAPLLKGEEFIAYYAAPLIAKGQVTGVLELFHRSPLAADEDWLGFFQSLAGQTALAIDNATLFTNLQRSNFDLSLAYDATIEGWAMALDLRDKETEGHSRRVTDMTERIAQAMDFGEAELVHVRRGALLHDVGKLGVPDAVLLKPGKLTDEEWVIMRTHPQLAYDMLSPIAYLKKALEIPYCHHEKWDGSGYPQGLTGERIPLGAQIFAVVDVWDALTSDRPYRAAMTPGEARGIIEADTGRHFDPKVVEAFFKVIQTEE